MSETVLVLSTVGEIARQFEVPLHRVEYAVRAHGIKATGRAGNVRVFDDAALAQIRSALGVVNSLRATSTAAKETDHAS